MHLAALLIALLTLTSLLKFPTVALIELLVMSQHRGPSNDKRNSQSRISNSQTGAPSGASAMLHSNRVSRDQDKPPRPDKKRYHTVPPPTWGEMRGAEKACVRCKGQHPVQECTRKRRKKKKR